MCIFFYCRIADLDLAIVWEMAKVTKSRKLVDVCISRIERQFNFVGCDKQFLCQIGVKFLTKLIAVMSSNLVKEETNMKAIVAWKNTAGHGFKLHDLIEYFNGFPTIFDMKNLLYKFYFDLALNKVGLKLPTIYKAPCMRLRSSFHNFEPAPSPIPSPDRYAAC